VSCRCHVPLQGRGLAQCLLSCWECLSPAHHSCLHSGILSLSHFTMWIQNCHKIANELLLSAHSNWKTVLCHTDISLNKLLGLIKWSWDWINIKINDTGSELQWMCSYMSLCVWAYSHLIMLFWAFIISLLKFRVLSAKCLIMVPYDKSLGEPFSWPIKEIGSPLVLFCYPAAGRVSGGSKKM
jgi:hypothetical protein